jgi:predicted RNA binding protein YcfA (HicA-like mRNA interferase family)
VAVLKRNGLVEVPGKGKGSHAWFAHPEDPSRCTAVIDDEEICVDLLKRIITEAGKTREEYLGRLAEV